jgi:hypothetical protein
MSTSLVFGLELATQTITWRGLFFNPFLNFATALHLEVQAAIGSSQYAAPHQDGVQADDNDAEPGSQETAALAQEPDEQGGEQGGQDGDIESIKTNAKSI